MQINLTIMQSEGQASLVIYYLSIPSQLLFKKIFIPLCASSLHVFNNCNICEYSNYNHLDVLIILLKSLNFQPHKKKTELLV